MVQGGGFTADMQQKPAREPIDNESANGLANLRGTIAMARTADPNSATAQFFINLVDNGFLDKASAPDGVGYCVFGRVVYGHGGAGRDRRGPDRHRRRLPERAAAAGRDQEGERGDGWGQVRPRSPVKDGEAGEALGAARAAYCRSSTLTLSHDET